MIIKVAIHSVPRSGSTWLGSIIDAHPNINYKFQPLFSYAHKGYLNVNSGLEDINRFFNRINTSEDDFINQNEAKSKGIVPAFSKSEIHCIAYKEVRYHHILENLLSKDPNIKVIGLIRNPFEVLYSWWQAPKEFRSDLGWNFTEEWLDASLKNQNKVEEFNGYSKWKEVALKFHDLRDRYPNNFRIVTYSDLINDPKAEMDKIMGFIGLELVDQQIKFIETSTSIDIKDPYGVFKKKRRDDRWRGHLPNEIVNYVKADLESSFLRIYVEQ